MSEPITIEDIYKLFQNSQEQDDRRAAEADRRAAEADRRIAEFERLMAESKVESDRRTAEFERLMAESKAEADRLIAESKVESDRLAAEREKSLAKLERTVERTSKAVDALTTRWGRFVEELVEPAVLRLFQGRGIDVKEVHPRVRTKRQGVAMEIDILAVDDTELVLVECKSRLSKNDVDEFVDKLNRFKISFPHYESYRTYGAVAGIEINEGIDSPEERLCQRYAYRQGLFVIKPSGEGVAIINDENFQPVAY